MLKFIIITLLAWIVGVFGWSQIIGSVQNYNARKSAMFTIILWVVILGVAGYFAVTKLNSPWAMVVGYLISFFQVKAQGRIE